jgi:predicted enzyme related to lactoylglutathione lyase
MDTRLDHVRANVADLRRAVEWYTTMLGFEVESFWPPDRPNYAHFKSSGGATFAVMEAEGRGARFNFTVDDPDALWVELKDRVAVVEPLFDSPMARENSRLRTRTETSSASSEPENIPTGATRSGVIPQHWTRPEEAAYHRLHVGMGWHRGPVCPRDGPLPLARWDRSRSRRDSTLGALGRRTPTPHTLLKRLALVPLRTLGNPVRLNFRGHSGTLAQPAVLSPDGCGGEA